MKNKQAVTASFAITFLFFSSLLVCAQTGRRERPRFKRRSSSARVTGEVVRGTRNTYIASARKDKEIRRTKEVGRR
ncbi:MAG: hypothetical protein LC768_08190 [Acidobacteria bacterium]|nr:hypothetical protein [Acidobacteriota bacterium]MCA1638299.1 hypothetical protein [Acidobacteriota bacterium]